MRKINLWLVVLAMLCLGLSGCQSTNKPKSSTAPSTTIKSNKYSTQDLQKRYDRICDQVMQPITAIYYSATTAELQKQAKTNLAKLDAINLELQNNTTTPELTQALQHYVTTAKSVLTAINKNDGKTYSTATKAFSTETSSIAGKYFQNQMPTSMTKYIKQTAKSSTTSSSAQ